MLDHMRLIHLALGGALVALGVALDSLYERHCRQRDSSLLDESLEGTFPASDPPATQDFTAPDERSGNVVLPTPGRLH